MFESGTWEGSSCWPAGPVTVLGISPPPRSQGRSDELHAVGSEDHGGFGSALGRRGIQAFRRRHRRRGRVARRAEGAHPLHHRPERRRQDLAAQHDLGLLQARHAAASCSRAATSPSKQPSDIAALGIARTFQNIALFSGLTVLDNLMLGRHVRMRSGVLPCVVYWGLAQKEEIAPSRGLRGDHRVPEAPGPAQAADGRAGLWPAQARRARPRAGPRAQAAAARRADGRHEPGREGGHGALHPGREPGARRHRRADRARHGRGHGHLRPRGRARSRPQASPTARPPRCSAIPRSSRPISAPAGAKT